MKVERNDLVFIVGIPRSGTTWVLCLFEEHPDCLVLTPEMLGIQVSAPTKETGLFPRLVYPEVIVERLTALPKGKLLVEKTPDHLLVLDKIKLLCPLARVVLVDRDPWDVLYSMVQRNLFWGSGPKDLRHAMVLYKCYSDAQNRFVHLFDYVVHYEDLYAYPVMETDRLFAHFGLSQDFTSSIVEKTWHGRSLPTELKVVFRKGDPGQGLRSFSQSQIDFIRKRLNFT